MALICASATFTGIASDIWSDGAVRRRRSGSADEDYVIRVFDDPAAIDAAAWDALRRRAAVADAVRAPSPTCARCTSRAAPSPTPAGRRSSSPLERAGAARRRLPALPEGPFLRRVRLRLGLGRRLPAPRPRLLPQAARRGAVHAGARAAPARARSHDERAAAAARHRAARRARPSSRRRTCSSSTTPTGPRRAKPAGRCAARCSSTGSTASPRRTPTSPISSPACSARSARRSSRSGAGSPRPASPSASRAATRSARPTGTSSTAATRCTYRAHHSTPYLTRDFFARMAATMAENWLLFVAWREGRAHRRLADRDRPRAQDRLRPLLGRRRARPLPALRGLLLPAARVVHRQRLPALRRRRAGRAQDGARPAAGADLVGALAGAPAVRARDRRLPRARRRRRRRPTSTSSTSDGPFKAAPTPLRSPLRPGARGRGRPRCPG